MFERLSLVSILIFVAFITVGSASQGSIQVEKNLEPKTLNERGVFQWITWEKEPSQFVWQFAEREYAYVLQGKVFIRIEGDDKIHLLEKGDFVTFAPGLRTYWQVVEPFKKHVTHEKNLAQYIYWKVAFKVQSVVRLIATSEDKSAITHGAA